MGTARAALLIYGQFEIASCCIVHRENRDWLAVLLKPHGNAEATHRLRDDLDIDRAAIRSGATNQGVHVHPAC
jgi:hypothetical protein|tara:strand:- start:4186 stop:4404 length:219 start_codon:yes stop_codon:yes gene_type:complete